MFIRAGKGADRWGQLGNAQNWTDNESNWNDYNGIEAAGQSTRPNQALDQSRVWSGRMVALTRRGLVNAAVRLLAGGLVL